MAGNTDQGSVTAVTHFGRQVRKERLARGWSIHELSARTGIAAGHLSRIENGKRPPTENIAAACDLVFPERRGWFTEYYQESRELPCIRECGDHTEGRRNMDWRTATYSNANGGQCVETASADGVVLVRDTTDRGGAMLSIGAGDWQAFLDTLR